MDDAAPDDGFSPPPRVPRDWLGHTVQLIVGLGVVGLAALAWGNGTTSAVAKLQEKMEAQDRAITESRAYQNASSAQMMEISRQLATIAAQVGDVREELRRRPR
jgi:hypothetical protein